MRNVLHQGNFREPTSRSPTLRVGRPYSSREYQAEKAVNARGPQCHRLPARGFRFYAQCLQGKHRGAPRYPVELSRGAPRSKIQRGQDSTCDCEPWIRGSAVPAGLWSGVPVYPGLASWATFSRPCGTSSTGQRPRTSREYVTVSHGSSGKLGLEDATFEYVDPYNRLGMN
jgi:hypothetical protein